MHRWILQLLSPQSWPFGKSKDGDRKDEEFQLFAVSDAVNLLNVDEVAIVEHIVDDVDVGDENVENEVIVDQMCE